MRLDSNFALMARYNQWMNTKIYGASDTLDEKTLREDQGAYFKSILGTLNHILVGDIIWLKRFAEHPKRYPSLSSLHDMANPASLDSILHDNLRALWEARKNWTRSLWRGQSSLIAMI